MFALLHFILQVMNAFFCFFVALAFSTLLLMNAEYSTILLNLVRSKLERKKVLQVAPKTVKQLTLHISFHPTFTKLQHCITALNNLFQYA